MDVGSRDRAAEVARSLGDRVQLVRHATNRGLGVALLVSRMLERLQSPTQQLS